MVCYSSMNFRCEFGTVGFAINYLLKILKQSRNSYDLKRLGEGYC